MTKFSITSAAVELGVSKETIRRRLSEIGIKTGAGETFTLRELFKAMSGDPRLELTRLRRAQADAEVRKNKVADNELISVDEAAQVYGRKLGAMSQVLDAMGAQLDARLAAESEPIACRKIINEYCESVKKAGREAQ